LRAQFRKIAGGQGGSRVPSHFGPIDSRGLSLLNEIPGVVFRGAIARLRAQSRLIMLLRFREQFSYDEVAFITDVSEDTVKSVLSRYRQSIPRYIIEHEDRIVGTAKGSASPS
jgi:DNA-directed RNA polymerase specialized sigma24 family protein